MLWNFLFKMKTEISDEIADTNVFFKLTNKWRSNILLFEKKNIMKLFWLLDACLSLEY